MPAARWQRLYRAAHALSADVRRQRPAVVCPWCKLTSLQENCSGCSGTGFVVEEQGANVPRDLMDEKKRLVSRDGRFVSLDDIDKPGGKRRRVET